MPLKPIRLYDTKERAVRPFSPIDPSRTTMYTCGPTVYDFAHIGNFRTFVAEDLLRRTLKRFGYGVYQVMNITDVDDKTIRGALKEGIPLLSYTKKYTDAFFEDLKSLNIEPAEEYPKATDYIPQMIAMIESLLKKEYAYVAADGSVYFKLEKFPCYGCLSHLNLEGLQLGASDRIRLDDYGKEHISDFVLWKAHDHIRDGDIAWPSPWGLGRPGWHIECSVMAKSLLGETIDIHAGGVDLVFPHHENEIAQSEAANSKPFSNSWFHVEHLLVDHKKMSKSLGNFYTLRALLDRGYSGQEIRFALLSVHYRAQMNFTFASLEAAQQAVRRVRDFYARLTRTEPVAQGTNNAQELCLKTLEAYDAKLSDDLNISEALAVLFDFVREVNSLVDLESLSALGVRAVMAAIESMDLVLGILPNQEKEIPVEVEQLLQARLDARKAKNFLLADDLRAQILELGFIVEDGPKGSYVKPKSTH